MSMRVLVAITGASGLPYATRLIDALEDLEIDYHGVVSEGARKMFTVEAKDKGELVEDFYRENQMEAPFSSGSYPLDAMVVVPCSMKTLSALAHGYASNLIARSADVMLKERRKLIVVPRETPLNSIHLQNMLRLSEMGAVILPAMPAFYHSPRTLGDMEDFIAGKILDSLGVKNDLYKRWVVE